MVSSHPRINIAITTGSTISWNRLLIGYDSLFCDMINMLLKIAEIIANWLLQGIATTLGKYWYHGLLIHSKKVYWYYILYQLLTRTKQFSSDPEVAFSIISDI